MTGTVRIDARSRNEFCRGKAISIKCYECVFLALGIRPAIRILGLSDCNIFFFTLSFKRHDFRPKKKSY